MTTVQYSKDMTIVVASNSTSTPPEADVSTLQPVRSPVSKFPLISEEAARAGLPLDARTSAIVAKAAAIAPNIVERIGCLLVRSVAPDRLLLSVTQLLGYPSQ